MSTKEAPEPYDVAVVGAGPVGLALAVLLARSGVRVAVIDPNRIALHHPRATHIDDETMRTLQTLGAEFLEPKYLRQTGFSLLGPDEKAFLNLRMPDTESDQGWFTDYQFHSPDFESYLRGSLASEPHASLLLGCYVSEIDQDDSGVTLAVRERTTDSRRTLRASFIVGTDGANSTVRKHVGTTMEDLGCTQLSLIVDIDPFVSSPDLPTNSGFVRCEPKLPVTFVPGYPPYQRFEFMLTKEHDVQELSRPEKVYDLLSRWYTPGTYRVMRHDVYEWHSALASTWRKGRVLLAGDSAHEMPPMLGQGLCSGLRDAMNLAWKLSLVVRKESADTLLDTYESERAAHVRPYIEESARQANMVEAFSYGEVPPAIEQAQDSERYRPLLGPGLVQNPGGAIGQLAPQPRNRAGDRLDDATGYAFVVVGDSDVIAGTDESSRALWARLGAVVLVTEPGSATTEWLQNNGARAAIIRPDRYVYALSADSTELDRVSSGLGRTLFAADTARVPA
ncbi:bifunctional 3-(3-hydroxy-phenyl)propionate/3-hydroxycinnamic acid hydroxylase [Nocardia australiensis]|uniref:bifunctional 3-(3-hydroxy-phenyl)propionate/3-hydroxycinnamic acid hydroxylase n=1 Tax=Nocardia australiensis TaxID=2887191 RepID=UPI001D14C6F6|nr:bifunctional 3-(3-hydroxy-phenyl)propionate/3-hydroxycinnamic acid hydroxylase [Nocardia australiensis]